MDLSYIYRQATFSPLLSLPVFAASRAAFHSAKSAPFLTLVKGEDIRQQNSGDVLDLMLRDAAVVGELFPPAQVAPPKKYFAAAFSRAAEEWRLERLLPSVLFPFASFLSYLKIKMQPPVKPFGPSASAWCPVSEIVLLL